MKNIQECTNCNLCQNQEPLIQTINTKRFSTFFVGLSAVRVESVQTDEPLSGKTRSGALLRKIICDKFLHDVYFTNIVKCLPLSGEKIRYPTKQEMNACFLNFELELTGLNPENLVLFGKQVSNFLVKRLSANICKESIAGGFTLYSSEYYRILAAPHPSYMLIYKRKYLDSYMKTIEKFLTDNLY